MFDNPLFNDPVLDGILAEKRRREAETTLKAGLPPEEAETLLGKVAGAGLGALHYVGSTLDKTFGGRSIRGLLAGKTRELLAPLPFSDTLGITNPDDNTSGRELLESAGVLDKKEKGAGFQWDDLAGVGAEMALDPSMYLTLGTGSALTKAGQQASKMGLLPKTAAARVGGLQAGTKELTAVAKALAVPEADLAAKPLAGLMGIGLPFAQPSAVVGAGDVGKNVAGWLDKAADTAAYSGVGRTLSRLFDPAVRGTTSTAAQKAMRASEDTFRSGEALARANHVEGLKLLSQHGIMDKGDEIRRVIEGTFQGPVSPEIQAAADFIRDGYKRMHGESIDVGRMVPQHSDEFIDFASRQRTDPGGSTAGFRGGHREKAFDASSANQLSREDLLRNIPGGTDAINSMVKDPAVAAMLASGNTLGVAAHLRQNYLGLDAQALQQLAAWKAKPPAKGTADYVRFQQMQALHKKSVKLADWIGDLDPLHRDPAKGGYFNNHVLTDYTLYNLKHQKAQAGAQAVHEMFANAAGAAGPGTVSASDALKTVGLDAALSTPGGLRGGQKALLDKLMEKGILPPGSSTADLSRLHLPKDVVEDAMRYQRMVSTPEALHPIVGAFDSLTNLTKAFQTSPFPAFHTRNMVTGLAQNAVIGASDPRYHALDPRAWFNPFRDALTMRSNGAIEGAADIFKAARPGITDAEATKLLMEEMFTHAARTGLDQTAAAQAIGKGTLENPVPLKLPGTAEIPASDVLLGKSMPANGTWNPLDVRGVGGEPGSMNPFSMDGKLRDETLFKPVRYGQEVGHLGDDLNRMSAFVALRRQGVDAAEAALRSKAAHYDYSRMTDFEREVMRRLVPFYSFTRQNLPFQLQELAARPGGVAATAVKGLDKLRSTAGFLPEQVSEGMAIPLGGTADDGTQRFLTHFGLPVEDAFSLMGTGADPVQRSLEKAGGMLNPIIKGPLEYLAGKQFYSGRSLDDLRSPTGTDMTLLDQVATNSPLSRPLTFLNQMADDRKSLLDKAVLALGPAKMTDVDTIKARDIAAREIATETLKGSAGVSRFENLHVKPEDLAGLTPEQLKLYQLYKYLEAQQREAAKRKKAAAAAGANR